MLCAYPHDQSNPAAGCTFSHDEFRIGDFCAVAVDGNGKMFLAGGENKIAVFDSSASAQDYTPPTSKMHQRFLHQRSQGFAAPGYQYTITLNKEDGQTRYLQSIAVNPAGQLYVAVQKSQLINSRWETASEFQVCFLICLICLSIRALMCFAGV